MAYDEALAERIRAAIGDEPTLTERRMFGGLGFMVEGNMAVAASSNGGIMVRVDPAETADLLATTAAEPMEMRGRAIRGWLRVGADHLASDDDLRTWVERGLRYAGSLPAK